ncbi:LCP family protein [Pseudonocardia xinjiangensis]|uniref:LCP family protein n=1 Tax=Pseudonocardia xinjiangensis TaxID=75289 RepID=UPI003D91AB95
MPPVRHGYQPMPDAPAPRGIGGDPLPPPSTPQRLRTPRYVQPPAAALDQATSRVRATPPRVDPDTSGPFSDPGRRHAPPPTPAGGRPGIPRTAPDTGGPFSDPGRRHAPPPTPAGGRPRTAPDTSGPISDPGRRVPPPPPTADATTRVRAAAPRVDPDAPSSDPGRRGAPPPTPAGGRPGIPRTAPDTGGPISEPGRRHLPPPPPTEATTRVRAATPRVDPDTSGPISDPGVDQGTTRVRPSSSATGSSRALDRSEKAERARRADRDSETGNRASHIDETLTRLTAAHAGLSLPARDGEEEPEPKVVARRRPRITVSRVLAGVAALLVFATTSVGWGTKGWLESSIRNAAALDPESSSVVDAEAQQGDQNVLIVASDGDTAATAAAGAAPGAVPEATGGGADTVTVAHIPAGGGPLAVLSIPNNLEINRPPCERWDAGSASYLDETERAEARTHLLSALDVGGPRCVTRVVQQLTGLAITKYVGVDLDSLGAMADAVGGANVCVTRPVVDGVLGPVVPDAGTATLEGVRAADFARAADVQGDPSSDSGRIERQQQLLASVLTKAVAGAGLLDVSRLAALRPALGKAVVTDGAGIDEVLALATSLHKLDAEGVQFAVAPTASDPNSPGRSVLRDTDAAQLFTALREDTPLPEQARDPDAASTGPSPADVKVSVLNASDKSGLATQVGETLGSLGFSVGDVGNADQPTPQTVIRFSPDQAAAAALLASTVPSATSVPDPGTSGELQLVLGRSFDDVVRAPAEPVALQADGPAVTAATATCP